MESRQEGKLTFADGLSLVDVLLKDERNRREQTRVVVRYDLYPPRTFSPMFHASWSAYAHLNKTTNPVHQVPVAREDMVGAFRRTLDRGRARRFPHLRRRHARHRRHRTRRREGRRGRGTERLLTARAVPLGDDKLFTILQPEAVDG